MIMTLQFFSHCKFLLFIHLLLSWFSFHGYRNNGFYFFFLYFFIFYLSINFSWPFLHLFFTSIFCIPGSYYLFIYYFSTSWAFFFYTLGFFILTFDNLGFYLCLYSRLRVVHFYIMSFILGFFHEYILHCRTPLFYHIIFFSLTFYTLGHLAFWFAISTVTIWASIFLLHSRDSLISLNF